MATKKKVESKQEKINPHAQFSNRRPEPAKAKVAKAADGERQNKNGGE